MAGPAVRMLNPSPDATNGVSCATRREARVTDLTAGLVPDSYRRYPTGPVTSSLPNARVPGPLPSALPQWRDGKARR